MTEIPVRDPRDVQFEEDMKSVFFYKTKSLFDFEDPYRTRLKNAYRFYGQKSFVGEPTELAAMTRKTMELL